MEGSRKILFTLYESIINMHMLEHEVLVVCLQKMMFRSKKVDLAKIHCY